MSDAKDPVGDAPEQGRAPDHPGPAPQPTEPPAGAKPSAWKPPVVTPLSPADAPPLLQLQEDKCPKCSADLSPDAVFCIKCGYDLRTNEVRTPTLGVDKVVEKPPEEPNEFSRPGRGGVKLLLGIGAVITAGAMVVAGLNAPQEFTKVVASVLLSLYQVALHTGTGVIAVLIASRFADMKPGNLALAAVRVFVAFATFQLLSSISFGEYKLLVKLLVYPAALAAYWGLIMLLFKKPRMIAMTVMVAHFVLWLVVELGMGLSLYVAATSPSIP